jgi:hypothetical protein
MKIAEDQTIYPGHQQQIDERSNYMKKKRLLGRIWHRPIMKLLGRKWHR